MSCRVLGRGLEDFILNTVVEATRRRGVRGWWASTCHSKERDGEGSLLQAGLLAAGDGLWLLALDGYRERPNAVATGEIAAE